MKDEALRLALDLALEALKESLYATTAKSQHLAFEAITAIKAALEAKGEPVAWKWHQAPVKTSWGDGMVVADLAIDKDHTASIYCERDQTTKVEAMFTPPQQEAKDEPDYKELWQQMCERCDELDKKLAHPEYGWTPERIAGMARLKAQQDKRLEPQRTWLELTNQELADCWDTIPERAMRRVEAKLKEKNT